MFCASPQRGREPAPLRCHPTSPLSSANGTAAEADGILDACAFGLSPAEVDDILFWCARPPSKILLHSDESSSEVPPDEGWASSMSTADLSPLREALQTVLLSSHHVLGSGASSPASAAAQSMSGQASTLGSGPSTAGTTMMGSTRKAILRPPSLSSPNGFTGLADPIDVTNSTAATFLEHIRRSAPYLPEARVPSSPTGYSFGRAGEAYNPWDSPDSSCIPYLRLNQTWSVLSVVPPPRSFVGWSSSNRRRPPVSRLVSDRLDAIFPAWHALTRWSTVATSACAKMPAQGSPSSATSRTLSDRCTPWQSFGVFPRHLGVGSAMVTASQWYQHVHQEVGSGGPLTSVDASMETQRDATCGRDGSSSTVFWKVRAEVHVELSQGSQLGTCAGSTEDGSPLQRHVRLFDAIRHFEESGTMHERVVWCLLNDGLVRLLTSSPVLDSVPTCPPHEDEAANATPTSPPMYFTAKWPRSDDAEDKNVLHNHREHALCEPVGLYVETHPSTNGDTGLQLRLTVVAQTRHRAVDGRRGMSAADDRTESQATIVEAAEDDEAAIAHAALSMVFPQEFIFSAHTTAVAVCPVTSGWGPGSPGPGHGWIPVSVASARTGRCMRYEPPSGISHQGTSISREDVDLPESGTDDDEVEVDVDELHAALTSAVMDLMAELESLKSFALLVQGSFYGTSVEPPLPPAPDGGEVEPAEYLSFVSATELASLLQCRLGVSSLRGWPFLRAHYDLLRHEDTLRLVGHESSTLPTPGAVHSEATLLAARIGLSDGLVRAQRQVHEVHAQVDQWIQQQVLQPLQTHENYLKRRANGARKMCATSAPFYGLPTLRLALQCCTNLQAQRIGVRGGTKASKALHASGPIRFVGPQARQQQADLAEGVDRLTAHMLDLCRIVRDEHLRMRQLLIVWRTLFAPHLVGVLRVMMEERAAREKLEAAFLPPSSHEPSTTLVRLTATSRAASSSEGDSSCAAIVVGRPSKRRPKVRHGPQRPEDVPFLVYRTKVGLTLCALAFVLSSVLILLLTGSSADAPQGWA